MFIKRQIKKIALFFLLIKDRWAGKNKSFDINKVSNLVLFVGPYRNLTTYLAANIALHPSCDVLNHAGIRVFANEKINFLSQYTDEKFEQFLQFFNYACQFGYKGIRGGNVVYSHAFETNPALKKAYQNKDESSEKNCLIWKESHLVTNLLIKNKTDYEKILSNDKIKFLFPVRNPLDCANSNIKTGKYKLFGNGTKAELKDVMNKIFEHYLFFLTLEKKYPSKVYFIYENEINPQSISALCSFLNVSEEKKWKETMLSNFKINTSYSHSAELLNWTNNTLEQKFNDYPDFLAKLKTMIN